MTGADGIGANVVGGAHAFQRVGRKEAFCGLDVNAHIVTKTAVWGSNVG